MALLVSAPFLSALADDAAKKRGARPTTVALSRTRLKPGGLRLGLGLAGTLPAEAFVAKLPQRTYLLLDLDGDGALVPAKDGFALAGFPFVVALPDVLLCEIGQCDLEVTGSKLKLTPQVLQLDQKLVAEASDITEIRIRDGLPPLRIDPDASLACEKHLDYLKANGQADGHGGVSMHNESPTSPGYTREGAAAGAASDLFPAVANFRSATWDWYASAWHGAPLADPGLTKVGVGFKHGVAMLYFADSAHAATSVSRPAEGAVNVPCSFSSRGETPNPIPGTDYAKGTGFPVLVRLRHDLTNRRVERFRLCELRSGIEVPARVSSPASPATTQWPTNSGCAVLIPTKPLAPSTTYRAELVMENEAALVWSFTTGSR